MKVSVVVPVYNAGSYIDACVRSVLTQSLPPSDYEVIFVDDGSTDGSGERLDAAAAGRAHVTVLHIANTGGPGGPRNLGLDRARGEYVYFLDSDDWLGGPEALARMHAMAARNGSDIVIGRMVGQGRGVSHGLFSRSQDRADILKHQLLTMMTPHKLFRTAFLREHGIRFPEGPVRLEDHRFCIRAYLKADVISVLADYPCCYWVKRTDEGNYSSTRFDPDHYYSALREVLDVVDSHVPPGPVRDRFYAHWFRSKLLKRMSGGTFLFYAPDYRHSLYEAVRTLTLERFGPQVDRYVPQYVRPTAVLLRAGDYDGLTELAVAEKNITVRPDLKEARQAPGAIELSVTADLIHRNTDPVLLRRQGERRHWEQPSTVALPMPPEALDVTDALPRSSLTLLARHRATRVETPFPITSSLVEPPAGDGQSRVTLTGEARLPLTGWLQPGQWALRIALVTCGRSVDRRLPGILINVSEDGEARLVLPDAARPGPARLRRLAGRAAALLRSAPH